MKRLALTMNITHPETWIDDSAVQDIFNLLLSMFIAARFCLCHIPSHA